jgi:predicted peptidase
MDSKRQSTETHTSRIDYRLHYLLYLPPDYKEGSGKTWPLLLSLHGAGERGDDLALVAKHGPPKRIEAGADFPFIVVSPQCPEETWWEPAPLAALLDQLGGRLAVNPDRVYGTGLSMGGFGTWRMALTEPERFAAIAPICGGGEPLLAGRIADLPVWAFHGAKDDVVPLSRSEDMVTALRDAGGDPKFTVYPEAEHDAWTETYENEELYDWLLSHRRGRA